MFAGFQCGFNLNTEMCRAWSPSPPQKKPKQSLLPVVSSPETLCFWAEHPSFLYRTPSVTLLPPLPPSPSLCFYLGAVRAPLLKLLLKREHIQWGLSQSLSVSIKDPGNTTLSREPLLKGQWDPGSFATWVPAPPIPSFSWEKRKKQESTQQINYSWMVCELCRALSQAPSAAVTCSVQTDAVTSDITVCNNTTWTPHCCSAPHIWWESCRHSSFYLHYSWRFGLFWLKRYVQTNSQTLWWHNPAYEER